MGKNERTGRIYPDIAKSRAIRARNRNQRDYGQAPPGFVQSPKNTLNFRNANVRLVPPDSPDGKAIATVEKKKKITKVAVDAVIEGFEGTDLSEEGEGNYKGEFAPNRGTPFEGMKFLTGASKAVQLTEDDLQCALYILRDGGSRGDAADIIGIGPSTLDKLAARNPMWEAAMKRAEALGKLILIKKVRNGDSHWQSAAWVLERKFRYEYGANPPESEENKVIRVRKVVPPLPTSAQLEAAQTPSKAASPRLLENNETQVGDDQEPIATTDIDNGTDQLIDRDGSQIAIARRKTVRSKPARASA